MTTSTWSPSSNACGRSSRTPSTRRKSCSIFTEHRDSLVYLVRRLEGMGYTGQVAAIHGGLHYTERQEQVELFRKPLAEGGARFLVATDAAGEGINLQFCWVMVNFDVPWNPARLEQRMGRIHRYGQKHDPVIILNLVAAKTREGRVLKTLLDKLEKIRKQLKSDKVFDVIGRIFEGVSIRQYMEEALTEEGAQSVTERLEGQLTKEQVQALAERDKRLFGDGGDVCKELPRLRNDIEREGYAQLLPGYVRRFITEAAPLLDIGLEGDLDNLFGVKPLKRRAIDPLLPVLDTYPPAQHGRLTVYRPKPGDGTIWLHPGEAVFEALRGMVDNRLGAAALRGGIFVDPTTDAPYLFHVALVSVVRRPDPEVLRLAHEAVVEYRLVGLRQYDGDRITPCPVEHLLLLRGGQGLPSVAQKLAVAARDYSQLAQAFLLDSVARGMAAEHRQRLLDSLPEREEFLTRGFDYQEAELAAARQKQADRVREGKPGAQKELDHIKAQQRQLAQRRRDELLVVRREPELMAPGRVTFIAHALVVPSSDPEDQKRHDAEVEQIAMQVARAHEEAAGATVKDVHTPELARAAGLPDNPGFDLLSIRLDGEKRAIEVKGRAGVGEVEVSANEWAKACNLRDSYWLFVVYDCATPNPEAPPGPRSIRDSAGEGQGQHGHQFDRNHRSIERRGFCVRVVGKPSNRGKDARKWELTKEPVMGKSSKLVMPIHFEDYGGEQFERLVFAYHARTDRWRSLEWYGQTGSDLGRDIWGVRENDTPQGKTVCIQCANRRRVLSQKCKGTLTNW